MKIGVPKEIKNNENRVSVTPETVDALVKAGHEVTVEKDAGKGSLILDEQYEEVGAKIEPDVEKIWNNSDMIIKVKEPIEEEYQYFHEGLLLFTYLHLADNAKLTKALIDAGVNGVAYETVQEANGSLPLLSPMSEVAGRTAVQLGAQYLERQYGGKGKLLAGVPGVKPGKVVVLGGGNVGFNAAKIAKGMGANVTILELSPARQKFLDDYFRGTVDVVMSNPRNIAEEVKNADIVVGAVLVAGRKAPVLVTEDMVKDMEPGSVLVDIAIDQGGNFETSDHATTHADPVYIKDDVIHYTVANVPGAVPQTATYALTNATMPYILQLANKGLVDAAKDNEAIKKGINTYEGKLTNEGVAEAIDMKFEEVNLG
ncbi:MAG: alanine dehydrogenase [Aerococcus sp.]|nr:alanine dehydrogenase [Aerococcus sp.]